MLKFLEQVRKPTLDLPVEVRRKMWFKPFIQSYLVVFIGYLTMYLIRKPGLDEGVVRAISARKNEPEFMLEWRLRAYRQWLEMREPNWAHVHYPPIDFNEISYFSAPKSDKDRPKSLDEVDPKLLEGVYSRCPA